MTGKEAEDFVAKVLSEENFFVGNFNRGNAGEQPFDQVAIGVDTVICYDVKHSKIDRLDFTRIEPNQRTALSFIESLNNPNVHTAIIIVYEYKAYYLSFSRLKHLILKGDKSIKITELMPLKVVLGGIYNE